jgi:hypothetical protein
VSLKESGRSVIVRVEHRLSLKPRFVLKVALPVSGSSQIKSVPDTLPTVTPAHIEHEIILMRKQAPAYDFRSLIGDPDSLLPRLLGYPSQGTFLKN